MDAHAVKTLRTRAFFRQFPPGHAPASYYDYAAGEVPQPWTSDTETQWAAACDEALQLRLGDPADDAVLHTRIRKIAAQARKDGSPWVLVGGPPCQAFSLIGRARNRGKKGYVPEEDERHFLYRHYLTILSRFRPTVFVLENVKGMLSSRLGGQSVFNDMFEQLQRPGGRYGPRYRIQPVVRQDGHTGDWEPRDFVVHAETLGLPQARHRVILLGILEDDAPSIRPLRPMPERYSVSDVIGGLPAIRSAPTDRDVRSWPHFSQRLLRRCASYTRSLDRSVSQHLHELADQAGSGDELDTGDRWISADLTCRIPAHLNDFIRDRRLKGVLNHQARPHMSSDLMRYGFAAAFTAVNGRSPRGCDEFPGELHPLHRSWFENNRFVDRFKVQRSDAPSSTITSHLAKDGHYYIHPDPLQLRCLTVREAARLQTFPDNYIFEGPPVSQRRQVGNAVPPWLGHQIAGLVHEALT
nr:DNA cytosine methyltransferase [Luteimonas sp. Y-2-2-4F]